jgi:hypothetical protein
MTHNDHILNAEIHEPESYEEVSQHQGWREAIRQELESIARNQTREIVD